MRSVMRIMILLCLWYFQQEPKPSVYLRFDCFDTTKVAEIEYHLFKYEIGRIDTLNSLSDIGFVSVAEFNALEDSIWRERKQKTPNLPPIIEGYDHPYFNLFVIKKSGSNYIRIPVIHMGAAHEF